MGVDGDGDTDVGVSEEFLDHNESIRRPRWGCTVSTSRTDADGMRRRELHDAAAGVTGARLLPWATQDGNPC